jgi:hypothetical protein
MVKEVSFDNETPKGVKHQGIEDNFYTWTFINLQTLRGMLQYAGMGQATDITPKRWLLKKSKQSTQIQSKNNISLKKGECASTYR